MFKIVHTITFLNIFRWIKRFENKVLGAILRLRWRLVFKHDFEFSDFPYFWYLKHKVPPSDPWCGTEICRYIFPSKENCSEIYTNTHTTPLRHPLWNSTPFNPTEPISIFISLIDWYHRYIMIGTRNYQSGRKAPNFLVFKGIFTNWLVPVLPSRTLIYSYWWCHITYFL